MRYDFVSIGDVVTDVFIRLLPDSARVIEGTEWDLLCMNHPDKIPFDRTYIVPGVGNSANAAVSAARLGLSAAFVSNIGDDKSGQEMLDHFKAEKIGTEYIVKHKGKASNNHYVLWYKDDRTILIHHETYEYHLPALEEPRWIYFSSVGEHAIQYHDDIAEYARLHPAVKMAFQPGTFQIKLGAKKLMNIYARSELFFCNREEAQEITESTDNDIARLARAIHTLGPKIVVITDGKDGAYASDGDTVWFMRNYPDPQPPLERTGAGDSFSSTFTAALALGKSVTEALMWAPINSMSVVQYVGAQEGLLRRSQLEKYLADAPSDYKPKAFAKI
ncbi:MAG: hypothetical protein A3F26_00945 [Candidatus Ryanbacteria bacterium RIFCSPHIGHO2_12_FULL_47_12b]|uniref:Carbohydrate kinase PfkB domain-containing protein n=2 Tax=Candidatus Ryaniibacteriota TaxID=1817914 RepID=A0A1G2H5Z9_9BACT|nr:MAG: Sugar kinase, ribokinase family [Parcubacteria group bacterium GW2011_GWA2_47_10b]OGZ46512.1 MAG: hypothetical protein A2844_01330 [Candidatus Ryanbacteria bacterium RIFCSPHIGHO2_01_FULL_48_80]OGZ48611.1 MAG: hypothetical protein A3C83_00820 [Candidatus Ryanbacteria bacterium RIFCSPHIGHO2_02_FULL_47_25]OGZ52527.1 MAG: hypothetical protein A3F26_00945 [Candidatus Ryanbacteria bacterium RIFCSPHIGHO2_12_FULL_47_12b]OGZ52932.1 MAG: hypothetical protein A3A29_01875 [Candidatus Ryanbacteria b